MDREVSESTKETEYLASFQGRRKRLTIKDINRISKQVSEDGKPSRNDMAAVLRLKESFAAMGENDPFIHYQPQACLLSCYICTMKMHF